MQIEFSSEQAMLLETAKDFCARHSSIATVRDRLDAPAINEPVWHEMANLGWLGINVPEAYGGLGMGISSVVPVAEAMGRSLLGSPYSGAVVAAQAIVTSGSESQQAQYLPGLVSGDIATMALTEVDGAWDLTLIEATAVASGASLNLSGTKCFVTDADRASMVVVSLLHEGNPRLLLLKGDQIPAGALQRESVIDQTRRSFQLQLDGISVPADQLLPGADWAAIEMANLLLLAAESCGGMASVLHLIVEYLKTRKAFDRTIGSYQSLKHPAVDILLQQEAARSHLYHAATLANQALNTDAQAAIRIAKAESTQGYAFAADRAIQFHGGFGFTFECDAQLYLRRAMWNQYQGGDAAYQRKLLETLLLDEAG